jgi:hypothetical protein
VGKRIERSVEKEKQDTVKRDSTDIYPFILKENLFFSVSAAEVFTQGAKL